MRNIGRPNSIKVATAIRVKPENIGANNPEKINADIPKSGARIKIITNSKNVRTQKTFLTFMASPFGTYKCYIERHLLSRAFGRYVGPVEMRDVLQLFSQ